MQGMLKGDIASFTGGRAFDVHAMCYRYPVWNSFWESLRAKVENIQCPLYTVASWTNFLHTTGTFRGWEESGSSEKWLRVHNTHEWPGMSASPYRGKKTRLTDCRPV
jgi:predicted acyl esterase